MNRILAGSAVVLSAFLVIAAETAQTALAFESLWDVPGAAVTDTGHLDLMVLSATDDSPWD
jgi:hypothetical protein